MKITENVHLIRQEFYVTPEVKRYVNLYLITGENCYLIDSGVAGSEKLIEEYLHSVGRKLSDIKGIFLTHAHPDHMGAAAGLKKITGCKVYAPMPELEWIEHIDIQYRERPIPNFYTLLPESVKVDVPLREGDVVPLEEGMEIGVLLTCGHSHGSMSFVLGGHIIFTGDAIPVAHDFPIFVDYEESLRSLERIGGLPKLQYVCPAWDAVYDREKIKEVLSESRRLLCRLKDTVYQTDMEYNQQSETEKIRRIFERADMLQYAGNPLVRKSIEACRKCEIR